MSDFVILEWSETRTEICKAFVAASGMLGELKASQEAKIDSDRAKYAYKYADLHAVMSAIREPYAANGLAVMQAPATRNGSAHVETLIMHVSGEWVRSFIEMKPNSNTPQALGSAITYARRYTLLAMTGLAAEDDDGGDASAKAAAVAERDRAQSRTRSEEKPPADEKPPANFKDKAAQRAFHAIKKAIKDGASFTDVHLKEKAMALYGEQPAKELDATQWTTIHEALVEDAQQRADAEASRAAQDVVDEVAPDDDAPIADTGAAGAPAAAPAEVLPPGEELASEIRRRALVDIAKDRGLNIDELNARISAATGRAEATFVNLRASEYERVADSFKPPSRKTETKND